MTAICLHAYVTGQVQGVFFRRETYEQANQLGLKGWVRNLSDGRVEVMICGEEQQVLKLQEWLWIGPVAAKVSNVEAQTSAFQEFIDFEVR